MGYVLTNYTVQCTDQTSGKTGCFLFDVERYRTTGKFFAVGKVFPNLVEFYSGTHHEERKALCVEHKGD